MDDGALVTRATIRLLARRRLNEVEADNWDDDILNTFINIAYAMVLKQVRRVDPEAVLFWDYRDTVAGTVWYAKPSGTRGPVEVGFKASASDTDWTPLTRKPYHIARDHTDAAETVYCHRGQYIGIFPAPAVSVTQGIQFLHAPTDSLAVDTDVPKLEETLQYAVAIWTALIAKGESPEGDTKDAAELKRILDGIPSDYGSPDVGQTISFTADVADARGRGPGTVYGPGVDRR